MLNLLKLMHFFVLFLLISPLNQSLASWEPEDADPIIKGGLTFACTSVQTYFDNQVHQAYADQDCKRILGKTGLHLALNSLSELMDINHIDSHLLPRVAIKTVFNTLLSELFFKVAPYSANGKNPLHRILTFIVFGSLHQSINQSVEQELSAVRM